MLEAFLGGLLDGMSWIFSFPGIERRCNAILVKVLVVGIPDPKSCFCI